MRRFDFEIYPHEAYVDECDDGKYVLFSDVEGMVAENLALKHAILETKGGIDLASAAINDDKRGDTFRDILNAIYMKTSAETPATDAAIAEIKAQGADAFAEHMQTERPFWEPEDWAMMDLAAEEAYKFAANLRAGRKG